MMFPGAGIGAPCCGVDGKGRPQRDVEGAMGNGEEQQTAGSKAAIHTPRGLQRECAVVVAVSWSDHNYHWTITAWHEMKSLKCCAADAHVASVGGDYVDFHWFPMSLSSA